MGLEVKWPTLERLYEHVGLAPRLPPIASRVSVPVYDGSKQVGYATSSCWSPLLKRYIALAHLEASAAKPEKELEVEITIEHRRKRAAARVRKLPFYDPPRKRA
jgi:aminomethyltransferase